LHYDHIIRAKRMRRHIRPRDRAARRPHRDHARRAEAGQQRRAREGRGEELGGAVLVADNQLTDEVRVAGALVAGQQEGEQQDVGHAPRRVGQAVGLARRARAGEQGGPSGTGRAALFARRGAAGQAMRARVEARRTANGAVTQVAAFHDDHCGPCPRLTVIVKKPKTGTVGSCLAISACRPDTTRLVLVPMRVTVPPGGGF
jgi:hypothetical protein